jgi:hypothetical protein
VDTTSKTSKIDGSVDDVACIGHLARGRPGSHEMRSCLDNLCPDDV